MERDRNIDLVKGLLIILVVLGHGLQFGFGKVYEESELFFDDYLFRAIYTFHMPLFMFISGFLFFHSNKKKYLIVIRTKLRSIGIPWLAYSSIINVLTYWFCRMDAFYFYNLIISIRNTMWFLSSLLLNCLVVASVTHLFRDNCISHWRLAILVLLSFLIPDSIIPSTHLCMFFFFTLGYFCCQKKLILHHFLANKYVMLALSCIFVFSLFFFKKKLTIYYGGICIITDKGFDLEIIAIDVLRYLIGMTNGLWFLGISQLLSKHCKLKYNETIMDLGRMTLAIYGFQCIAYVIITECLKYYKVNITHNYVTPIIMTLLVLLLCKYITKICKSNKYSSQLFLGIYYKQSSKT